MIHITSCNNYQLIDIKIYIIFFYISLYLMENQMSLFQILLFILIITLIYLFFFTERVIVSEDMTNVDISSHNQCDYNV
jgi:hypothetical protein